MAATTWKDENGFEWVCEISIGLARRLRSERDIDLLDEQTLTDLPSDPFLIVDIIAECHSEQIEKQGITKGDFCELCTNTESVAIRSVDAFNAALANFLRRMHRRPLADLVDRAAAAARKADEMALEEMRENGAKIVDASVAKMRAKLRKEIAKATKIE